MRHEAEKINPGHTQLRKVLCVVGPLILAMGILLVIVGAIDIFTDPFSGFPFAFLIFAGMPMIFVGGVMTQFAFMGAVFRYVASETAPVGKDTFNYMAKGTQPGVRDITSAIREGLTEPQVGTINTIACSQCHHPNDADARFCDQCGNEMITNKRCTKCNNENDLDARFCDNCGNELT